MSHNTFIYRHSDLPPVRSEIKAQIVALDCQVADLILKSQGNYRELKELAEVLDDSLNSCELNLKSIQIIPDNSAEPPAVTLTDLPMEQQKMIFSTALFNAMVLSSLEKVTGADVDYLIAAISMQINTEMESISDKQITEALSIYLAKYHENPIQQGFKVKIPTANN
ncbi:hypothetical protein QUB75_19780 [Microcoleus sp. K1-B6]|uniref:hypothetical protein n=1 Tax=Microcoleus sp. K1-B6 TaxID=2818787 RepID=UPI002FD7AA23